MIETSVGVYVHVPFCERVCPYCDFAVVAARRLEPAAEAAYVDAVLAELAARRAAFGDLALETVYFGGGTPSLLRPESIARMIAAVRDAFGGGPEAETTLEVNPSTVERARLPAFAAAGVGRLSVGIQSFDDAVLRRLGRAHRADEARATLRAVRTAGFENVSLDLIYGVPGQSLGGVRADLDEAVRFAPEHVSAYELTVEPGTPYATAVGRGQLALPDEELAARMFEAVQDRLGAAGYEAYELASHAQPGRAARHNRRYWERLPVLGLGVGAWSTQPRSPAAPHGARRANVRDLPTYLARVRAGRPADAAPVEVLDPATARGEAVFLALRTARGVSAARFAAEFGAAPRAFFAEEIDALAGGGLLVEDARGDLRLSARGRLLSDAVFERFVHTGARAVTPPAPAPA